MSTPDNIDQIIELLNQRTSLQQQVNENKLLLSKMACTLGLDQKMLYKVSINDFLHGYLLAQGLPVKYAFLKLGH